MIINGQEVAARPMPNAEGEQYFRNMVNQIAQYQPDEIIAVMRSGAALAMWTAQQLELPLGAYWHENNTLVKLPSSRRLVFVDDNIVRGTTRAKCFEYLATLEQAEYQHKLNYIWAVHTSDAFGTPIDIRNNIIQGGVLDYFVEGPLWAQRKIPQGYDNPYRNQS
jgi:hypothetical protein